MVIPISCRSGADQWKEGEGKGREGKGDPIFAIRSPPQIVSMGSPLQRRAERREVYITRNSALQKSINRRQNAWRRTLIYVFEAYLFCPFSHYCSHKCCLLRAKQRNNEHWNEDNRTKPSGRSWMMLLDHLVEKKKRMKWDRCWRRHSMGRRTCLVAVNRRR